MKSWSQRPIEEFSLLNPAFCCLIILSTIAGYDSTGSEDPKGIPYPLLFLILPIVLHKETHELLPKSSKALLSNWIDNHPEVLVNLYERIIALKPYIKESILFGSSRNVLSIGQECNITSKVSQSKVTSIIAKSSKEVKQYIQKAKIVGKWFKLTGSVQTLFTLWGVRL